MCMLGECKLSVNVVRACLNTTAGNFLSVYGVECIQVCILECVC